MNNKNAYAGKIKSLEKTQLYFLWSVNPTVRDVLYMGQKLHFQKPRIVHCKFSSLSQFIANSWSFN